jgi:hypothetical protein
MGKMGEGGDLARLVRGAGLVGLNLDDEYNVGRQFFLFHAPTPAFIL